MHADGLATATLTLNREALVEELAAARRLYATYDPDCPPWSIEPELRRLEALLANHPQAARRPNPGRS